MDVAILRALHDPASAQPALGTLVVLVAQAGIFLLPLALVVLALRSQALLEPAIYGILAATVALILGFILEHVLDRPRPFIALGFTPLFPHANDSSLPSDHTLIGVALVGPLLWRALRVGTLLVLWALVVGVARVAAGVHYPSDILLSALLALCLDALLVLILRRSSAVQRLLAALPAGQAQRLERLHGRAWPGRPPGPPGASRAPGAPGVRPRRKLPGARPPADRP